MTDQAKLTDAELVFVTRMLPHIFAGKSLEDAGRAVLDDDARIYTAFCDRATDQFVPGYNDHTGRSYRSEARQGDVIASELCRTVYERLMAKP